MLESDNLSDIHQTIIRSYEVRRRRGIEGPKLWRMRAKILERGGMPERVQRILRKVSYMSPKSVRVLDLGCGAGFKNDLIVQSAITHTAEQVHIIGCDIVAQSDCIHPQDERATFSFRKIPVEKILEEFGANSFDVVTGIALHHHLGNIVDVSSQVNSVLKPGGIHLVADNFCWKGSALAEALSKSWLALYRWCEGNGFYNEATSEDVVRAHHQAGLEILGRFYAPLFVEGIIGMKKQAKPALPA